MPTSHSMLSNSPNEARSISPTGNTKSKLTNMKSASESMEFNTVRRMNGTHGAHNAGRDRRRTRVSKACERCRLKKIKCDGELPCQKCKNNGHICTPGIRKRTIHVEYKQVPKSYVEFLETTHLALIGCVHKLYSMIQKNQPWDLGDPELNDQGELVIHDIAKRLGCIGPNDEIEMPIQYELPTTATGMARLAAHPERQQYHDEDDTEHSDYKELDSPMNDSTDGSASSLEPVRSIETELDLDHRRKAFAGYNHSITNSPQSLCSIDDSDHGHSESEGTNSCATSSPYISSMADYTDSSIPHLGTASDDISLFLQPYEQTPNMGTTNWELGESNFNALKNNLSTMSDFEIMLTMEDQMVLPGYNDDHSVWLSQTLSEWREEGQVHMRV